MPGDRRSGAFGGLGEACIRCPMLSIDPKMLPRLELEQDLLARRDRAITENWLGEIDGSTSP